MVIENNNHVRGPCDFFAVFDGHGGKVVAEHSCWFCSHARLSGSCGPSYDREQPSMQKVICLLTSEICWMLVCPRVSTASFSLSLSCGSQFLTSHSTGKAIERAYTVTDKSCLSDGSGTTALSALLEVRYACEPSWSDCCLLIV